MVTDETGGPRPPLPDPEATARRLAVEALGSGDPIGWFERLYTAAENGDAAVPWDRGAPHPLLVDWVTSARLDGTGRRAVVVGCGLGHDAQFVAGLGFDTTAFDVSATAVRAARSRFPGTAVNYLKADVLSPPPSWCYAFDLVVESLTFQALPDPPRRHAIVNVAHLVAPGGTLLVISRARDEDDDPNDGPPATHRWRAQFSRR